MSLRIIYLMRNMSRNPLRSMLTCAAVALPIVIFVLSTSVVDGVNQFLNNSVKQLRLVVTNKSTVVNPLPERYRREIQSLDPTGKELTSVCGMVWIGGTVPNDPQPLSTLAADHDTFFEAFPEYKLPKDQMDQWFRDRQAIIVGKSTADQMGWKVGDRITFSASLPPYSALDFHLIGTPPESVPDKNTNFCRRDYIEEERIKGGWLPGLISFYFVKCGTREALERYQRQIDETFARTPDETKTQDEKAFMSEYINQQFNLPRNLTILSTVTVFVAIMAAMNTMSMNFRDRLNEFATLKSLGFTGGFPMWLIASESMLLCAAGGLIGALAPYVVFMHTPMKNVQIPVILTLVIREELCLFAVLISLGIGLLAGLWPAYLAARMHVINALRSLE